MVSLKEEIVALTSNLIRFRTTVDRPEEIVACTSFIKEYFKGVPIITREFSFNDHPSLLLTFNRRKKQRLMLNGHYDVVEGANSQFSPEVKDGKLYGRGSSDMKGGVATMMVLMKHLALAKKSPLVGLMLVSDEESGGLNGTKKLVSLYKSDLAIIGESTKFHLVTKHKGALRIRLTAYGSASHASRPWQGVNAIEKMFKQYSKFSSEVPQASRSSKWLPTINPTNFIATGPYNVTPSKAEMILDIRTTEEFTSKRIINILKRLKIKYKKLLDGAMLINQRKNDKIRSLKKITERIVGKKVKYIKSCGASDARFFTEKKIPALELGPPKHKIHKQNEYVDIASLPIFYKILETYIEEEVISKEK